MRRRHEIPLDTVERIMKKQGVDIVANQSRIRMSKTLQWLCQEITRESIIAMRHAGRKTLKESDIEVGSRKFFPGHF